MGVCCYVDFVGVGGVDCVCVFWYLVVLGVVRFFVVYFCVGDYVGVDVVGDDFVVDGVCGCCVGLCMCYCIGVVVFCYLL